MRRLIRIYVAGPYSQGDPHANTMRAIAAGEWLAAKGFAPFIPHLSHFWHQIHPHPVEFWYAQDNAFLVVCDGLLRLTGASQGADAEVDLAMESSVPVFYSIGELLRYFHVDGD